MGNEKIGKYILGLDIGANSIGWAILNADDTGDDKIFNCLGLDHFGARAFEMGVDGDLESGREESRGKARREARSTRRQVQRRSRRLRKLFNILQRESLLPQGNAKTPEDIHKLLEELDKSLLKTFLDSAPDVESRRKIGHVVPYLLRARALDTKLEPHELGRAIYHLAQRRGFLSNRKAPMKDDEEAGKVKDGIHQLEEKMEESGARTLGEYFSKLDPEQERIRSRWTSRRMFLDEFEKIWTSQRKHHPDILNDDLKKQIHEAIFFQRPLKSAKHLIGKCEYEPDRPRAPWAILDAQRFRMIQKVNNLEIVDKSTGEIIKLTPEQRKLLIEKLDKTSSIKFNAKKGPDVKKLLNLSKNHIFNFEKNGDEEIIGNKTAAKLIAVFGEERWNNFPDVERDQIVEDVITIEKEESQAKRGMTRWGLVGEAAKKFGEITLEDKYCSLSRQALKKLLPQMENGTSYMTAVKEIYGVMKNSEVLDSLPPVTEALTEIRNPVVMRALSEVRKVVNAIIREHGKPAMIRVELTREMKKTRKQREQISKKNRDNEKGRVAAKDAIKLGEVGIDDPNRDDILKYLLAEECGWKCPYTGKAISMGNLFKSNQFDIEHIIPMSRSLDNSFVNKTLCYHEENRNVKRNRTPYEAYSGNEAKYNEILQSVATFKEPLKTEKLKRFKMTNEQVETEYSEFSNRQFNDTSYASRLAIRYLGMLYGGVIDETRKLRVQSTRGMVTAYLRNVWNMNGILNDGGVKTRSDHRHHAIDAVAIALTNPGMVKKLSDASKRAPSENRRQFGTVDQPWDGFLDEVREKIAKVVVSHRVSRKVNGALHEETFYSPPKKDENGKECRHVRKRIDALSKGELENIVDPIIKHLVKQKLDELGGDPKKAFADPINHPCMIAKDGRKIPIHKVRIRKYESAFVVGNKSSERHVVSASNHHIEVFETTDKKGKIKWDGELVSQFEAMRRLRAGEHIIKRNFGDGKKFVFSLANKEVIEINEEGGKRGLYVIRTVSMVKTAGNKYPIIYFVKLNDARKMLDIKKEKALGTSLMDPLRKLNCQKVSITPLGDIRRAND